MAGARASGGVVCDGMSYTIKNLRDIEDKAPQFGIDAVQAARFAHYDLDAEKTGLAFLGVKPGCARPSRTATTRRRRST